MYVRVCERACACVSVFAGIFMCVCSVFVFVCGTLVIQISTIFHFSFYSPNFGVFSAVFFPGQGVMTSIDHIFHHHHSHFFFPMYVYNFNQNFIDLQFQNCGT